MADEVIIPTQKHNLNLIRDEFEAISKQLSRPSQFFQKTDDNLLNTEICTVFQEAASILKGADLDIEVVPQDFDSPIPFLNYSKLQLERLSTELDRRIRLFDKSLSVARQICNDRSDKIQLEYKTRLEKLKLQHKIDEKKLGEKLAQIQQSFDTRLHTQVAKHMRERNQIEAQVNKLKSELQLTETTLTTSLAASQMRAQLLEKQRNMLRETNSQVSTTISDKLDQQMRATQTKCRSKLQALESENKRLTTELKATAENYTSEMKRLTYELENIEESHSNNIDSLINAEKLVFEKKKRKINSRHDKIVSDLRHEMELENMSSLNEIQILKSEIELQEQYLRDSDKKYANSVEDIEKNKNVRMMEIDNEMKLLTKMQTKTLKQLAQKHELDIEQEAHDAVRARQDLDQRIIQTQRDAELNRKRLEAQITALTRAKDKFEEDLKATTSQKNMVSQPSSQKSTQNFNDKFKALTRSGIVVEFSIVPQKLSQEPEIEDALQSHIRKFCDASSFELVAIERAVEAVKAQFETERMRLNLKIEETQQGITLLEGEKEDIQKEINAIQTDLASSQSIATKEQLKRIGELQKLSEEQESTIAQIRDDIKSKKVDGVKKVDIDVIKEENELEIRRMKNLLEKMETNLKLKLHEVEVGYENEVSKEQMKTQDVIDAYRQRIQAVLEETKKTKEMFDVQLKNNYQVWSETRKSVVESSQKINRSLPSRSGSRPGSSTSALSPSHTPLPLLKH